MGGVRQHPGRGHGPRRAAWWPATSGRCPRWSGPRWARLVTAGRPDALAAAILETVRQGPAEASRRAEAATTRFAASFSIDVVADATVAFYRRALAVTAGQPPCVCHHGYRPLVPAGPCPSALQMTLTPRPARRRSRSADHDRSSQVGPYVVARAAALPRRARRATSVVLGGTAIVGGFAEAAMMVAIVKIAASLAGSGGQPSRSTGSTCRSTSCSGRRPACCSLRFVLNMINAWLTARLSADALTIARRGTFRDFVARVVGGAEQGARRPPAGADEQPRQPRVAGRADAGAVHGVGLQLPRADALGHLHQPGGGHRDRRWASARCSSCCAR